MCLSARALIKLGRFDDASERIERALALYPQYARPFDARGELFFAKGEFPEAAEAFQKALSLDPSRQRTRMQLGQVLLIQGKVDEADALKADFMRQDRDNQEIANAVELEKEEKFAEAENIYRQILTRNPDNVSAMRLWARLGIKQERYAEAESFLQQAVKLAPGFARAWADLCKAQFEQEKQDEESERTPPTARPSRSGSPGDLSATTRLLHFVWLF